RPVRALAAERASGIPKPDRENRKRRRDGHGDEGSDVLRPAGRRIAMTRPDGGEQDRDTDEDVDREYVEEREEPFGDGRGDQVWGGGVYRQDQRHDRDDAEPEAAPVEWLRSSGHALDAAVARRRGCGRRRARAHLNANVTPA